MYFIFTCAPSLVLSADSFIYLLFLKGCVREDCVCVHACIYTHAYILNSHIFFIMERAANIGTELKIYIYIYIYALKKKISS